MNEETEFIKKTALSHTDYVQQKKKMLTINAPNIFTHFIISMRWTFH